MTCHASRFREGTVVRYTSDRPNNWCREGIAIADDRGLLLDTYWGSGFDCHVLTQAEADSAEVMFDLNDYRELDRYAHATEGEWSKYAQSERQTVTSQHGLQRRYFVLIGATHDRDTIIGNARDKVAKAQADVDSAQRRLEWVTEDLDALLAEQSREVTA